MKQYLSSIISIAIGIILIIAAIVFYQVNFKDETSSYIVNNGDYVVDNENYFVDIHIKDVGAETYRYSCSKDEESSFRYKKTTTIEKKYLISKYKNKVTVTEYIITEIKLVVGEETSTNIEIKTRSVSFEGDGIIIIEYFGQSSISLSY